MHTCDACDYKTPFLANLNIHKEDVHNKSTHGRDYSGGIERPNQQRRRDTEFCRYWNRGHCQREDSCKYLHEEAPECIYGDRCHKKTFCSYFHADLFKNNQSSSFLGQRN